MTPLALAPLIRAALLEDLGRAGDITTAATIPAGRRARAAIVARQHGIVAGMACVRKTFAALDPALTVTVARDDAAQIAPGDVLATLDGDARAILAGERVALNFLGHCSGIATATGELAAAIAHTRARICCTRKTTPGLRALEKHAVRCGGGVNHRFGLDDAILIKDNHIAIAGGVVPALTAARAAAGHLVKIEIEVDTLDQLREAMEIGADAVLLDNMAPPLLREAVAMVAGRAITEASGGITRETAPAIAETGVDLLSVGWITHSAPVLDLGLDM